MDIDYIEVLKEPERLRLNNHLVCKAVTYLLRDSEMMEEYNQLKNKGLNFFEPFPIKSKDLDWTVEFEDP